MLTTEIIRANESLKGLDDDQVKAIAILSENDENTVIAKKVGQIHGDYDKDIEEATGMRKPDGVKTYDFLKNKVLPVVKTAQDDKSKSANDLQIANDKVLTLEKAIKENTGDESLKQRLKDAEDKAVNAQSLYDTDKTDWESKLKDSQNENLNFQIGAEFDKGLSGLKFKDEKLVSKNLREIAIRTAKASIMDKYSPDFQEIGEGKRQLVFRDAEGVIMQNKDNKLEPFTAIELMMKDPSMMDIVDVGRKQGGAGSGSGTPKPTTSIDVGSATNQVDADRMILKQVMGEGLVRGTSEFVSRTDEIRKDSGIASLPTQ